MAKRKYRHKPVLSFNHDQYRDEPRTRVKQVLDIFMGVAGKEINPVVTDFEDILPSKKKKPNPGWKKLEEVNLKRYVAKVKKERDERWSSARP